MRELAWKEWRQNRAIVVITSALMLAIFLLMAVAISLGQMQALTTLDCVVFAGVSWTFAAVWCGASLAAPEIGNGSLQFLSALPISRKRIWLTKIMMGFAVLAISILTTSLLMAILVEAGRAFHVVANDYTYADLVLTDFLEYSSSAVFLFVAAAFVTMLSDRTVTAIFGSCMLACFLYSGLMWTYFEVYSAWNHSSAMFESSTQTGSNGQTYQVTTTYITDGPMVAALFGLTVLLLLWTSYRLFIDGETLKTNKRFTILSRFIIAPGVVLVFDVISTVSGWFKHS